ncbi:hypothetical protein GHT06_015586 [Daphnia sinensis]|uniref:Uncharacterized protein n=1 Tax=Daphnia sinensis TaxID=1820382 RepID=A0AAD5PTF6_9CRUS|nr:hypothetical protein GHT06_015586 [Daphnia sinensis]
MLYQNVSTDECTAVQMEFVFLLLAALVAVSQQFQQPGRHWPTSRSPLPWVVNNRRQSTTIISKISRHSAMWYRPIVVLPMSVNELYPSFLTTDLMNAHQFVDANSRIKGSNGRRPLAQQQMHVPRFSFSKIAGLYLNRFIKTAVFTSSVTLTAVQSCVAAINVFDTGKTTFCRRKRDVLLNTDDVEDHQFDLNPSEPQEVIPTAQPTLDLTLDDDSLNNDAIPSVDVSDDLTFDGAASSSNIQDTSIGGVSTASWWENLRRKLFTDFSLTSITVTSYSFYSTTVTKTVHIAGESQVKCLPSDWVVCY